MAVLLWVSQASVTYDLHKCEWVSRASPSVFGVILLRSKIFYCAHSCQRLPRWCRGFLLDASCSRLLLRFQLSHFQAPVWDPENKLCFSEPRSSSVCALTGLEQQQSQYSIVNHHDVGDFSILEGEGRCRESHPFSQGKAFCSKCNCVSECFPGYRMF